MRNLRILFAQIPEVVIDDYGSVKDWFKEATHESYWTALVTCLLDTETEVKVAYRALARIYHPDKHDPMRTGMTHAEASEYFKIINNAQAYLCDVL